MKRLSFEVEQGDILNENEDSQFAVAKIRAFHSGESRNSTICSRNSLESTSGTIYNKPILYNINRIYDDFGSHADPSNSLIAGFVVPDSAEFVDLPDGRTALDVIVKIWKKYAPKAMSIFKQGNGKKKVSVEVDINEYTEDENGLINMIDFVYSGVCILGDMITEGSPGASMQILSFAEQKKEYFEAIDNEIDDLFSIPESVKNNAVIGAGAYKLSGKNIDSVAMSFAKNLYENDKASINEIDYIIKTFNDNEFIEVNEGSDRYTETLLYGGREGFEWASNVKKDFSDLSNQKNIEFDLSMTFPYKSLDDVNPAIKGIKPPVSLAQANAIASQADAIIAKDKSKNGWAIAISDFKKTHVVKNGRWVKKETNMEKQEKDLLTESQFEEEKDKESEEEKSHMSEDKEKDKKEDGQMAEEKDKKEESKDEEEKDMACGDSKEFSEIAADESDFGKIAFAESGKEEKDYERICFEMFKELKKTRESYNKATSELDSLKEFKKEVEASKLEFEVNKTIQEVREKSTIPQEKIDEFIEKSKQFSLETITAWKNEIKAEALDFAVKEEDTTKVKFQSPWGLGTQDKEKGSSIWDD